MSSTPLKGNNRNVCEFLEFKYGTYNLIYPKMYYPFLKENFIFDIYRTDEYLKKNNIVLDLGATIGDFSVLASKKVGKNGRVIAIEPNYEDYKVLKLNIQRNNCQNVIPINSAAGKDIGEKEITFMGRKFRSKMNTLENILAELSLKDKINFIKMDIEGYEFDVISKSIEIIKKADVISLECHMFSKEKIDQILSPHGFFFRPTTLNYIYKEVVKNSLLHPLYFFLPHGFFFRPTTLNYIYKKVVKNSLLHEKHEKLVNKAIRASSSIIDKGSSNPGLIDWVVGSYIKVR